MAAGVSLSSSSAASAAPTPRFRVATGMRASFATAALAVVVVVALIAAPSFVSRGTLKELFFVLTLIALAQYWNLLAGYAGILSIGQQAYVGLGGYMLFALTAFAGFDPIVAIVVAGAIGGLVAIPAARLIFRLSGPYLGVGTWVLAEVFRLVFAQMKSLGGRHRRIAANFGDQRRMVGQMGRGGRGASRLRRPRSPRLLAGGRRRGRHGGARLRGPAVSPRDWRLPPSATTRRRRVRSASTRCGQSSGSTSSPASARALSAR